MVEYKLVSISRSSKAGKKMQATFMNKKTKRLKTTHFGAKGMKDYTLTGDKERRRLYRQRHLSYYILWGDSKSKRANIASFRRRFFS